jgi:ribonuclease D
MEKDLPPRFILPDLALAGIVQRPPRSREELRAVRGLDGRYLKTGGENEILAAVESGREMDPQLVKRPPSGDPSDEHLGPSVALGLALVAQLAADRGIEPTLLANRADVQALAGGRRTGRLSSGWRSALAGESLRALFAGEAALTADGKGGVALVEPGNARRPGAGAPRGAAPAGAGTQGEEASVP